MKSIPEAAWKNVRGSEEKAERFTPKLPKPPKEDEKRRITFLRLKDEIELLGDFFFDNPKATPTEIGNRCFDDALEIALREK